MRSTDFWRCLQMVAGTCLVLQFASAVFLGRDLQTPNASTRIAESLVSDGTLGVRAWHRLRGNGGVFPAEPLRAFQLPGEPLFLAAGFKTLPKPLWRFIHIPVTVVFVTAVAAASFFVGGRPLALAAGLVAALDPFVIVHGPVWDDTFLATAAEWVIFAGLAAALATRAASGDMASPRLAGVPLLMALSAACAAASRLQSQTVLMGLAIVVLASRSWRPAHRPAWAVALGVTLAVGAWGVRNAMLFDQLYLGTSHDGLTLFESNYKDARASILETGTAEGFSQTHLHEQFARVADLGEVEADREFRAAAWQHIVAHPLDVAKTAALKLAISLTGVDLGTPLRSARNMVTIASSLSLMLVGPCGLWLCWGQFRDQRPLALLIVAGLVTLVLTLGALALGPVGIRYRIGLTGFLYIGSGTVLLRALETARRRAHVSGAERAVRWS